MDHKVDNSAEIQAGLPISLKPSGDCARCKTRPATKVWSDSDTIGIVHGMFVYWCERCCVEAQLLHARKMAATIPELEQRMKDLT